MNRLPNRSLAKEGSLLGLAATGLAMHVAPNLAMKAVKSTKAGHNLLADTMRVGFQHGVSGQKMGILKERAIRLGFGP